MVLDLKVPNALIVGNMVICNKIVQGISKGNGFSKHKLEKKA